MIRAEGRSIETAPRKWNERLSTLRWASILQTWQWGDLKSAFGWQVARVESAAGMAQVLFRPSPIGPLAYLPLGPACTALDELPGLLDEVHAVCRSRRAIALKVEPHWNDGDPGSGLLAQLGFRPSFQTVQPRSTAVVDLEGDEIDILARMKPKTRYNIRLSQRRGVQVRPGTEEDLETFADLIDETGRRDGFGVHPPAYYHTAYRLFVPQDLASLWVAEHAGEPLAAVMVFAFAGAASYLYGASSDRQRNLMPNYSLQWQAILWARSQGCRWYDLWGIPDEVGVDPEAHLENEVPARTGLWGVWRFKRGFGVNVVRRAGAWDYVYSQVGYLAYQAAYRLRGGFGG